MSSQQHETSTTSLPQAQPAQASRIPLIGEAAPAFTAVTTQGSIHFPDEYKGKWVVLFSHPADFTPVCTTEFMTFATLMPQFEAVNCKLIGLSIDSNYSHIAWLRTIKEKIKYKGMENVEVTFPVIADLKMEVARATVCFSQPPTTPMRCAPCSSLTRKRRCAPILYYPLSTGRNFQEILRLLVALQTADKHKVATPADWQPGEEVIVPPPGSCGVAQERMTKLADDTRCLDWFLCLKRLPKESLTLPPMWAEPK